ncbi:MAG: hypothetical protein R3C49_19235 [Planctomycetaceae bacterium]
MKPWPEQITASVPFAGPGLPHGGHVQDRQQQCGDHEDHDRCHDQQHQGFQHADDNVDAAGRRFSRLSAMPISTFSRLFDSSPIEIISTISREN